MYGKMNFTMKIKELETKISMIQAQILELDDDIGHITAVVATDKSFMDATQVNFCKLKNRAKLGYLIRK